MAKSQKEAVVELVCSVLGSSFALSKTNALSVLTSAQLSAIKDKVYLDIMCGAVAYSKPLNSKEVKAYASSMVMNHLKKSKELNGGGTLATAGVKSTSTATSYKNLSTGIDISILPEYAIDILKDHNEKAIL